MTRETDKSMNEWHHIPLYERALEKGRLGVWQGDPPIRGLGIPDDFILDESVFQRLISRPPFDRCVVETPADRQFDVARLCGVWVEGTISGYKVSVEYLATPTHFKELAVNSSPDVAWYLDGDGRIDLSHPFETNAGENDDAESVVISTVFSLTHTFAAFHARGFSVREAPLSRGVRRRLKTELPESESIRVKWIDVTPMSDPDAEQRRGTMPAYMPLHRVHGHYAIYTAAAPLFGWYVGQVWRSDHWRGDRAFGEIKHRYAIKPLEEVEACLPS